MASGMVYIIVLNLAEGVNETLAEKLRSFTLLPVTLVKERFEPEANQVFLLPPGKELVNIEGAIKLVATKDERHRQVPVDMFFRFLAETYGRNVIAVVLSGHGSDGTIGLRRVKENGGIAFVQEPSDAECEGMPRSAIATGYVDIVLPAADMTAKIVDIGSFAEKMHASDNAHFRRETATDFDEILREVLTLLKIRTGHDFSNYKRPTMLRRIARRLQVHELREITAYLHLLREQPDEIQSLLRDLLITVTNFFRDKESFAALAQLVIPKLFAGKTEADSVRVWICGSATGEEAYSLAMLLHEHAETMTSPPRLQVFATDINEDVIRHAREGRYDEAIVADIAPELLQKYFTKKGDFYFIIKELRETVLFAPHNVLRDPPFSRMDLISCRNLLIYLNRETQIRVMDLFHFGLRQDGYLFLGSSESADNTPSLFMPVDKKNRIYKSRTDSSPLRAVAPSQVRWETRTPDPQSSFAPPVSFGALHHKIVERYAPPSILVNEEYEILHSSEHAGRFLRYVGGEPSRNLLKLVQPALQLDLRAALVAAKREDRKAESRRIRVKLDDKECDLNLVVRLVDMEEISRTFFLVIFEEEKHTWLAPGVATAHPPLTGDVAIEAVVKRLEEDLANTRDRLHATLEQSETSTEELKASNEELQAINEELRSAGEELETSKEELQSLNEELTTVNHELKGKVDEVGRVNSDLQNLMHSTDIGTIFMDRSFRIKRYTARVEELFNIIDSDIGRPFEHLTHKLDYDGLAQDAAEVLQTLRVVEKEVRCTANQNCYLARIVPYRTMDDRIDGVVLSFLNVTDLKRTTDALFRSEKLLRMAQSAAKAGVWHLQLKDRSAWWSEECYKLHGFEPAAVEMTMDNWIRKMHYTDGDLVEAAMMKAIEGKSEYKYELKVECKTSQGTRWLLGVGRATYADDGDALQFAGITLDITERVRDRDELSRLLAKSEAAEEALKLADRRKDEFLATLSHELRNPLAPLGACLEILRNSGDPEKASEALAVMERQISHLTHLVDDLLDLSRITEGKINLNKSRFNFADAVQSAVETCRSLLETARHQLTVALSEGDVYVEADFVRISQVLVNLLNNAIKYTEPGGRIFFSTTLEDQTVVVRIRDTGMGIPETLLPRIFDMFTQDVRSNMRPQSGLGIGLGVVKKLVEMHKGTVEAFSEGPDRGSEFVVRLPLAPVQAPLSLQAGEGAAVENLKPSSRRILIGEDNKDAADSLKIVLTRDGHSVRVAYDGKSTLRAAAEFQPEVILLDIGLPDIDGCEVARVLRQTMPHVVVIAISGWGQEEDRRRSREAGFDHHLVKPVRIADIRRLLALTEAP